MNYSKAFVEIKRILTTVLSFEECEKVLNYINNQENLSFNEIKTYFKYQ